MSFKRAGLPHCVWDVRVLNISYIIIQKLFKENTEHCHLFLTFWFSTHPIAILKKLISHYNAGDVPFPLICHMLVYIWYWNCVRSFYKHMYFGNYGNQNVSSKYTKFHMLTWLLYELSHFSQFPSTRMSQKCEDALSNLCGFIYLVRWYYEYIEIDRDWMQLIKY